MADNGTKASSDSPVIAALKGLPQAHVKPISGEASVNEKSGYVGELVTYSALDNALSDVADAVEAQNPSGVLIVEDRALLHSSWAWESISSEVGRLGQNLDQLRESIAAFDAPPVVQYDAYNFVAPTAAIALVPAVAGLISAAGAAPSLLGAVADVVGMFRTEYATAGRSMSPQGTPVVVEMSRLLRSRNVVNAVDGFMLTKNSKILADIESLRQVRADLDQDLSQHRQAVLLDQAKVDATRPEVEAFRAAVIKAASAETLSEQLSKHYREAEQRLVAAQRAVAARSALIGHADKILASLEAFLVGISTAAKEGGDPPLLAALLREALFTPRGDEPPMSHVLFVSLDSIGLDIVDAGKRLKTDEEQMFVGGLQVSYLLLDVRSGVTTESRTIRRISQARFNQETGQLTEHWTTPVGGPGRREAEVRTGS